METIGSKVLFLILWVCVAVSPCFGRIRRVSYYYSGSSRSSSSSSSGLRGWQIGLTIGGIVVIIGIVALYIFCKVKKRGESRDNVIGLAPVEPNVYQTQQLPMYPSTAMPYNTNDALDKQNLGPSSAPQAGFTTPYPATTSSNPPQPYQFNNGTVPYPTDGTNPATMGIVQPPPYESKTA